MMILPALQWLACVTLAVVAIRWRLTRSSRESAYRVLLPFIVAAAALGMMLVYPFAMETFIAYYSGAIYEMEAYEDRFSGPYRWVHCAGFILPVLPTFGLLPWIGKRPTLMVVIATLALIPPSYTPAVDIITRLFDKTEEAASGQSLKR